MIRNILRKIPIHPVTSLLFLLLTVILLAGGLGEIVRGATWSAFVPVGVAAALTGWVFGSAPPSFPPFLGSKWGNARGAAAWGAMIVLGAVLLWGSTAQFNRPLLKLAESLPSILSQAFLWVGGNKTPPDFSIATETWFSLITQSSNLWQRVAQWMQGLESGVEVDDPIVYVLIWSTLQWLVSAWEGWFMRRGQVLTATIPSLILLADVTYNTGANIIPLWGLLSITLLLMGLMRFEAIFRSWAKRGVDYAEIILDTTVSIIVVVTLALMTTAWAVPSFAIQPLINTIHGYQTNSGQGVVQALGLKTTFSKQSSFIGYNLSGLPNQHLIGAGPELSHELVMTVGTGELPPISNVDLAKLALRYHWRSNTFDRYTGHGWASSPVEKITYEADTALFGQVPQDYRILRQNVNVINQPSGVLYWAGTLYQADQPFEAGWRTRPSADQAFGQADLLGTLSTARNYNVESLLPIVSLDKLRAAPRAYPQSIRQRYLQLPDEIPERVLALARGLTATSPTPYDQAKAIERYLRSTYPYTLDLPAPPAERDLVDYFLFDLQTGYCDYYASAMVVLARASGLPARMVLGYASGTFNPSTAKYEVTQADAHAWVEIYFAGIGWVEFEPTASQPEINQPSSGSPPVANQVPVSPRPTFNNFNFFQQNWSSLALWSVPALIGLAALAVVLQIGESWLLTKIPTTRAMQLIYFGLYRLGRNLTGPAPADTGETASEFAARLRARLKRLSEQRWLQKPFAPATDDLDLLTSLYLRALYTLHPPQKDEMRTALRAWQALRWRLLLARVMPIKNPKS